MMASEIAMFIEDLAYVLLVDAHMGRLLKNLGKFHWEGYLVHIADLIEASPVGFQIEDLREAPLLLLRDFVSRDGGGCPCK